MIKVEGTVQLQLSPNSVGLLESLSNTMKPIGLISLTKEILAPGKFADGKTSVPFEFKLSPSGPRPLLETYHGVYICVQYMLTIEVKPFPLYLPIIFDLSIAKVQRGSLFSQAMQESTEFIVEVPVRMPAAQSSRTLERVRAFHTNGNSTDSAHSSDCDGRAQQDKQQLAIPPAGRAAFALSSESVKKQKVPTHERRRPPGALTRAQHGSFRAHARARAYSRRA